MKCIWTFHVNSKSSYVHHDTELAYIDLRRNKCIGTNLNRQYRKKQLILSACCSSVHSCKRFTSVLCHSVAWIPGAPSFLFDGYRGRLLLGVKRSECDADYFNVLLTFKIKYTPNPPYSFMACTGTAFLYLSISATWIPSSFYNIDMQKN